MSHFIKVLFLFLLFPLPSMGDEISYFRESIDYWGDKGKKN